MFELEDGTWLEYEEYIYVDTLHSRRPLPINPSEVIELVEGKKVFLSYRYADCGTIGCMIGEPVVITCLREADVPSQD